MDNRKKINRNWGTVRCVVLHHEAKTKTNYVGFEVLWALAMTPCSPIEVYRRVEEIASIYQYEPSSLLDLTCSQRWLWRVLSYGIYSALKVNWHYRGTCRLNTFACCVLHDGFFFGLLFNPEDGGYMFLRNVGWHYVDYRTLCPRRKNCSLSNLHFCCTSHGRLVRHAHSHMITCDRQHSLAAARIKNRLHWNSTFVSTVRIPCACQRSRNWILLCTSTVFGSNFRNTWRNEVFLFHACVSLLFRRSEHSVIRLSNHISNNTSLCKIWGSVWLLLSHWPILRPWRWRRHVPPKRRLTFNGLHGITSQKLTLLIFQQL
jgi:hypothetical protein